MTIIFLTTTYFSVIFHSKIQNSTFCISKCNQFLNRQRNSLSHIFCFYPRFNKSAEIRVTAADALSGIDEISCYKSEKAYSLDEIKTVTDWTKIIVGTDGTAKVSVPAEDAKQFVYYIRITDKAGNITYLSTDGAVFDTQTPIITGIENGAVYYTTQKFGVVEIHPGTVTVNGETVTEYVFAGNVDTSYEVIVRDRAGVEGNSTTVTVTMKPISDISKPIDELSADNVTGGDADTISKGKEALESVDTENATDEEKAVLAEAMEKAELFQKVIDDTKEEVKALEDAVAEYEKDNIKSTDEAEVSKLITDLTEKLNDSNLTEDQKDALKDALEEAQGLAEQIAEDKKALEDAVTGQRDTTEENYTLADKTDLEKTADALEEIEKGENGNYTEAEKETARKELDRIHELVDSIERTEDVVKKIEEAIDAAEGVEAAELPDSAEIVKEIAVAKQAYDGTLSEKEKSLSEDALIEKLEKLYDNAVYFRIIKGADGVFTRGDAQGLEFTANEAFELFTGVHVDGKTVDSSAYTAKAGSTVVTLSADYLKTLANGIHSFEAVYKVLDGEDSVYSTDCVFTVQKRDVSITAKDQTVAYGESISQTAVTAVGLLDGHTVTVTLTQDTAKVTVNGTITASAAVIMADGTDVTADYKISYTDGKLVIEPDTAMIDNLTGKTVTSANEADIKAVKEMLEQADSVKEEWETIAETCDKLLKVIEAAQKAADTANMEKTENITAENVKLEDKTSLERAKTDLEKALEEHSDNYTDAEKQELQKKLDQVTEALEVVWNVENVNELIS